MLLGGSARSEKMRLQGSLLFWILGKSWETRRQLPEGFWQLRYHLSDRDLKPMHFAETRRQKMLLKAPAKEVL